MDKKSPSEQRDAKGLDLGQIDTPLLIFGGPYGNLEATEALLFEMLRLAIPPERVICTGDLVAYCADPQATVNRVREAGFAVVMGNCEEALAVDAATCGCGFEDGSPCDTLAESWYSYCVAQLDGDTRLWMDGLPRHVSFTIAGRRVLAVHGSVSRINRFIFPGTEESEKAKELNLASVDGVIAGHSGLPFTEIFDQRLWHNSGALGLPANDGTPRVWYSLMTPSDHGVTISHHPLSYDHRKAAGKIRECGLPAAYASTLETGLWPNDEIMPRRDRLRRGRLLRLATTFWRSSGRGLKTPAGLGGRGRGVTANG